MLAHYRRTFGCNDDGNGRFRTASASLIVFVLPFCSSGVDAPRFDLIYERLRSLFPEGMIPTTTNTALMDKLVTIAQYTVIHTVAMIAWRRYSRAHRSTHWPLVQGEVLPIHMDTVQTAREIFYKRWIPYRYLVNGQDYKAD